MDISKLTYADLEGVASVLDSKAAAMAQTLQAIRNELEKVGSDDVWSGTAANQAMEEFRTLYSKFTDFSQAVTDEAKYLRNVVANYQSVDSAIMGQ